MNSSAIAALIAVLVLAQMEPLLLTLYFLSAYQFLLLFLSLFWILVLPVFLVLLFLVLLAEPSSCLGRVLLDKDDNDEDHEDQMNHEGGELQHQHQNQIQGYQTSLARFLASVLFVDAT